MNLLVDIGNTSIKFSSFVDNNLIKISQIKYSKKDLKSVILFFKNKLKTHNKIYICSVVSEIDKFIIKNLKFHRSCLFFINKKKLSHLVHKTVNLRQLGNDRIINVLSAINIYPKSKFFIIVDLGTATTLDIIINRKYYGGVILPGLATSYENLISLASGIKNMKFSNKYSVIGKNTNQALMSGFNVGYKIMIESYIKLIKTTYKRNFKVIFTGGYANSIDYKKTNFIYREDLTLLGIFFYHIFLNEKLRITKQ